MMNWTTQQQAIFEFCQAGTGSLNIQALAGTGKTTTIVEIARRVSGRVFLGAFTKAIADELASRIEGFPNACASTLHSMGYRLWRETHPKTQSPDSRKIATMAREIHQFDKRARTLLADIVGFAKLAGFGIPDQEGVTPCPKVEDVKAWEELLDHHELTEEIPTEISVPRMIRDAQFIYQRSLAMCNPPDGRSHIDFDDMLLAPLVFGAWKPQRFDWVLLDECQDTNETRRRLAQLILKPGGRFVAVGDVNQAIFAFAGANSNAMDLIQQTFNSAILPLSVTYRCPKKVVALAKDWVPMYEAAEGNAEGSIRVMNHTHFWKAFTDDHKGDGGEHQAVLCRNTRPLVGIAQRLRKEHNIPCLVEGNSARGLVSLAVKWGEELELTKFLYMLSEHEAKETAKFMKKKQEEKAEALQERCSILRDLARDDVKGTVRHLVARIELLFGIRQNGEVDRSVLRLCTIHRSKGREWDRVWLIGRNTYQPSYYAKTAEQLQQERNLEYVAVTRTKKELVEVNVPPRVTKDGRRPEQEWWEE